MAVAVLCTAAVLTLTHLPPQAIPKGLSIGGLDKLVHGIAYAAITMSFLFAVDRRAGRRLPMILVLGIAALAAVDEWTQPLVGRTCCGWDYVADLVGIAAACGVWKAAGRLR